MSTPGITTTAGAATRSSRATHSRSIPTCSASEIRRPSKTATARSSTGRARSASTAWPHSLPERSRRRSLASVAAALQPLRAPRPLRTQQAPAQQESSRATAGRALLVGLARRGALRQDARTGNRPHVGVHIRRERVRVGGLQSLRAEFTSSAGAIQVSAIASTQMACAPKIMSQESIFFKALASARSYTVNGGKLTLRASGGRALVTYEVQSQQLAGTSWNVLAYNNGKQGVESVIAATSSQSRSTRRATCADSPAATTTPQRTAAARRRFDPKVSSTRKECATPNGVMTRRAGTLQRCPRRRPTESREAGWSCAPHRVPLLRSSGGNNRATGLTRGDSGVGISAIDFRPRHAHLWIKRRQNSKQARS